MAIHFLSFKKKISYLVTFHTFAVLLRKNWLYTFSESESYSVMFDSLQPQGLYSPWNSPGQNAGVGSLSLHQGIIPTQESNPDLLHCRWIFYQLSHKGSPRILEWVAYCFSSGSCWPRNWTGVSALQADSLPTELSGKPSFKECGSRWWHRKILHSPPSMNTVILQLYMKQSPLKKIWKLAEHFLHLVRWQKGHTEVDRTGWDTVSL